MLSLVRHLKFTLERGKLMVGALLNYRLFFMHLLCAVMSLMLWIAPSESAQLRDIRIGEHENYTRIVFELDHMVQSELELVKGSRQLNVIFSDTQPDLKQKIPIERARHLKDIQLWISKDKLSTILKFSDNHAKIDSFPLNEPPRLAVDIYWQTSQLLPSEPAGNSGLNIGETQHPDNLPETLEETGPGASDELNANEPLAAQSTQTANISTENKRAAAAPPSSVEAPTLPTSSKTEVSSSVPPNTKIDATAQPPANKATNRRSNWLQYYLVIALVIITISILVLLVLMLLTRYRWIKEAPPLSANEFLKRQDDKLNMLDARIKEQLNRYDNA